MIKQDNPKQAIFNYYNDAFGIFSKDVLPIFDALKIFIDIESLIFLSLNLDQS